MGLLSQTTDYTDLDFDALRWRLQNLIRSVFPTWTDFNVANFGNVLLELFAFVGDVLVFKQDNQARESRLLTATQRKNVLALCKLLGFRPAGAAAATAIEVFTLATAPTADVRIPRGTTVRSASVTEPIAFQLLADVVITAGASPPIATGSVEHSAPQDELVAATGLPGQEVVLPATPYLDGSADVTAANGTYAEVLNFLASTAVDRHIVVLVDQNDRATLRFGNGINGALPSGTITARYKIGGGAIGNVNADTLTKLDGGFTDAHGNPVVITVTNPQPATGGAERQTIAQIRALAPESIRVLSRTVSREDFEVNARRLPAVARALMLTSNEEPGIAENAGILFVIPRGGGLPTPALKDAVRRQVTVVFPSTLTFQVAVQDPVYRAVDVQATVFLRQGANAGVVRAAIQHALAAFFAISLPDGTPNPQVDFGWNLNDANGDPVGQIAFSDVFNVVRDVAGVRKIGDQPDAFLLNGARRDVVLARREFPVLGQVELRNGATGQPL
ncbi:MAG TPA: baseplate J/gp47 family protein [Kofleriaceae bacterium]|nr:baseplate J/gp47 family protein [Kofleriaceae bacterium]